MKNPVAGGKSSFPGELAVKMVEGIATAFPRESQAKGEDLLETVYDHGPLPVNSPAPPSCPHSIGLPFPSIPRSTAMGIVPHLWCMAGPELSVPCVERLGCKVWVRANTSLAPWRPQVSNISACEAQW